MLRILPASLLPIALPQFRLSSYLIWISYSLFIIIALLLAMALFSLGSLYYYRIYLSKSQISSLLVSNFFNSFHPYRLWSKLPCMAYKTLLSLGSCLLTGLSSLPYFINTVFSSSQKMPSLASHISTPMHFRVVLFIESWPPSCSSTEFIDEWKNKYMHRDNLKKIRNYFYFNSFLKLPPIIPVA